MGDIVLITLYSLIDRFCSHAEKRNRKQVKEINSNEKAIYRQTGLLPPSDRADESLK